jgi:integrase
MSLYRRGEWWWIDLSSDQGRVREPAGTTDRKEAQEYHAKREQEIWRRDKLGEAEPVTWGEAVTRWLDEKPRSLPERYMIKEMGFSPSDLMPLSSSAVERKLSALRPSTFNRYLAIVLSVHTLAKVQAPSVSRKPTPQGRTRWLSAEEWQKLHAVLKDESPTLADLAEFSVHTGVRENNALELRWDQLDLKRRVAWFYADQMKGRVPHGIPLNDAACAVLERRRGIHKVYVFPAPDSGKPYVKASNRAWYASLKKSKLKGTGVVWHTLRHTFAAWAVMSGVRLEEVMKLGGWKTYQMVLRYSHLAPEHMAEAANKIKPISRK